MSKLTTAISLESSVMQYARTKSKELGVHLSAFIGACIGLEILNPLNQKTIPKATKIAGTVELIGLEKAREVLSEDSDLTLRVIPKETPVFEPKVEPKPSKTPLSDDIKAMVADVIKKEIPNAEDMDAAASSATFSSDITKHDKECDVNGNTEANALNNPSSDENYDVNSDKETDTYLKSVDANAVLASVKAEVLNDVDSHIGEIDVDSIIESNKKMLVELSKTEERGNITSDKEEKRRPIRNMI